MAIFSSLAAVVSALGAMGCSSSSSPPPSPPPSCDMTKAVSFSKDVIPVFKTGCALTSVCHGQTGNVTEESLYLGENTDSISMGGMTDPSAVHGMLVDVVAKENPLMSLVKAGDTANSYLWHKINGDQNTNATVANGCSMATAKCSLCTTSPPCGVPMPDTTPLGLVVSDPAGFCVISSWISQGAKND